MKREKHRLLFVDVDGVLVVGGGAYGYEAPDPVLVGRVQALAARTGAKVVLSSLWRLSAKKCALLERKGLTLFGMTPNLAGQGRAAEIAAYVTEYREAHYGADVDYVILDDDDGAEIAGHFYACDPDEGLSEAVVASVLRRW